MNSVSFSFLLLSTWLCCTFVTAQSPLEKAKQTGLKESRYLGNQTERVNQQELASDVASFRETIAPILKQACQKCHGPDEQEADFRTDTLDPDLLNGKDESWWLEVQNVLANKVMPPADSTSKITDADRSAVIQWLANELRVASTAKRNAKKHSSFRRLNRYEFDYALQDLLGLNYSLAKNLPPESKSDDGFINSSDRLQMSPTLFAMYRETARQALHKATVGSQKPTPVYYSITMDKGRDLMIKGYYKALAKIDDQEADKKMTPERASKQRANLKRKHFSFNKSNPHFYNEETGDGVQGRYSYGGARYSWTPLRNKPTPPENSPHVLNLPAGTKQILDLGDHLPDSGTMRIRLRASRLAEEGLDWPQLQVSFGFQPSNNSQTDFPIGRVLVINSSSKSPQWYEIQFQLGEISRNAFRGKNKLGVTPNPSEYLVFRNLNNNRRTGGVRIEYVEITAPYHAQWPPESHLKVLSSRQANENDIQYARRILTRFMRRAWRRDVSAEEIDHKLRLFSKWLPLCNDFREAMIEVLATVIASPNFIYVSASNEKTNSLSDFDIASRLSFFLWSSLPDDPLLDLASRQKLQDKTVLSNQIDRMLKDDRSRRFHEHFVRQWLGLELLDFLDVDRSSFGSVDDHVKNSMKREPIELFRFILNNNLSVLDFLHSDYTLANGTLAQHYGIDDVYGIEFKKISLAADNPRGGLLTQAGLLAMNSDGKETNPLKRGIWLLEKILNDPPPPPPPSVPEIDLTDPDILKLTLKERLEDHRNDVDCQSCHARIHPWGIAFENFDAVGQWRDKIGSKPVDAESVLFNQQKLEGINGLKRYLLKSRQDQFVEALVFKLSTYALGRPLGFSDHADIQKITSKLRREGDGLKTLVKLIATSDMFHSK